MSTDRFVKAATEIILDPKYQPVLGILKGTCPVSRLLHVS